MHQLQGGKPDLIKQLHKDLARKWRVHGSRVTQIWRSLKQVQREKAIRAGAARREVLKDPTDTSLGSIYKLIPEWNIRDLTKLGSDYLLDILRHRATTSLCEQYAEGANGEPGDAPFIFNSMEVNNLRHVNEFKHCFTLFMDEDTFGKSYSAKDAAAYRKTLSDLSFAVEKGVLVPQSTGELILERLMYLLQGLNIVIEDILEAGASESQKAKPAAKKSEEATRAALSNLSLGPKQEKPSLLSTINSALDQKICLEEYLQLCRTSPSFLASAVNYWFYSRPEMIPDEKGRVIPTTTDKYISISVFEAIHNAITVAATWDFIYQLLQIVEKNPQNQLYKTILLQELSNVCNFEFERVLKQFKRYVQIHYGQKHFKRISGVYDNGVARVNLKTKPESIMMQNPQLHHKLRLCQPKTDVTAAVTWIQKLDDLHRSHPDTEIEMLGSESEAFGDIAVTAVFIQSLSRAVSLPPASAKRGQMYISRLKALMAELDLLKTEVDLADFAAPIDGLTEPGMAEEALKTLDKFTREKTGTQIGFLYEDLNDRCLADLETYYKSIKESSGQQPKVETSWPPLDGEAVPKSLLVQQRKEKSKTRPPHSSVYNINPDTTGSDTETENEVPPPPVFKVKQQTAEVFSTLFSKADLRGSVNWDAFTGAMADLKFSVMPRYGSVFAFYPSEDMNVQQSFTVHRPHQSRIEGHILLRFAGRLKRLYGWDEKSFQVV
ncbi:hypothetical protein BGW36DRAFT_391921 [Talaromyces proteolyticus]|uniref:Ipa protein n=1 Tax=Talaromyces proteolyticus TaxID=1131652 RepID=A0AAD4KEI9_9EURO|nr:uncharacterized protein BGW36DRAFT_391921 [Talaromyces proteolyticus]KAH8689160.1 hypothetical protein BGW36DRAFT_391921 [Talaromyces proteolyticus]